MKDAVAGTYTVHINPAGIKSYTVCKQPNKPKPQNASALAYTHTRRHTRKLHYYFLPGRVLKRLSAIHIPFFFFARLNALPRSPPK